jgi:predicted component of type VI protein secretion system
LALSPTARNVLGRHPSATLCVADGTVGRQHCEIVWSAFDQKFRVTDIDCRNHTRINGVAIPEGESALIDVGDEIQCGDVLLLVVAVPSDGT